MLARNLSKEFAARGHQCHIAAISNADEIGNSPSYQEAYERDLDAHSISRGVIGHSSRRNPLLGGLRLRRIIRQFRPDVIHVHTGHGLMFLAFGLVRRPVVYTHHNIRMNFPAVLFRVFDRFVDRYVAICTACEAMLRQHVRKPMTLIYNGVPSVFASAGARQASAQDPVVLAVGALTPQKDYPTLIRAAALCVPRMAQQGRRIRFQVAGSGGSEPDLRRVIEETGMEESVDLLGTRTDISSLMARADLVANSSIFEGFPIALIEAAMSSLPVVASDVGGSGEIVIDGESGRLVPPERPDLLAEAIVSLLSDSVRYAKCSARAGEHARLFTLEACADAHLALYQQVLDQPR